MIRPRHLASLALLLATFGGVMKGTCRAADCDANGIEDATDVAPFRPGFVARGSFAAPPDALGIDLGDVDGDGDLDAIVVAAGSVSVHLGKGDRKLGPAVVTPTMSQGIAFIAGDLDGEGTLDLAVAGDHEIGILLHEGNGRFRHEQTVLLGLQPISIVSADFDRDGNMDLAASAADGETGPGVVSLLRNLGAGRFEEARNYYAGDGITDIVPMDRDGDGDFDLAVGTRTSPIALLTNDGAGRFSEPELAVGCPAELPVLGLRSKDMDGDGDPDLGVTCWNTRTVVLQNERGEFRRTVDLLTLKTAGLELVDLDSNGRADVLLLEQCSSGKAFLAGSIAGFEETAFPELPPLEALVAGDVDRDGSLDFLCLSRGRILLFAWRDVGGTPDCNGNGIPDACDPDGNRNGFPDECDVLVGPAADCNGSGVPDSCKPDCDANGLPDACEILRADASDCDADGVLDVCDGHDANGNDLPDDCEILNGPGADCDKNGILDELDLEPEFVLSGDSEYDGRDDGVWRKAPWIQGDLDGDGHVDLVVLGESPRVLGNLQGNGFAVHDLGIGRVEMGYTGIAASDLDRDGDLDLALAAERERRGEQFCGGPTQDAFTVTAMKNDGGGSFEKLELVEVPCTGARLILEAADFSGDGITDLLAYCERFWSGEAEAGLWIVEGRGTGSFAAPVRVFEGKLYDPGSSYTVADLDRDGDADLATAGGLLLAFEGGSFKVRERFTSEGRQVISADFDLDGDMDLAGGLVALNAGKWTFTNGHRFQEEAQSIAAGDLDGDGYPDLIRTREGRFSVHRSEGGVTFGLVASHPHADSPSGSAIVDVNADGLADFVTVSDTWQVVRVYANRGAGDFEVPEPLQGTLCDVGDLDGDGDVDLAAVHPALDDSVLLHWNTGRGDFLTAPLLFPPQVPAGGRIATLRAGDIDRDGISDLVISHDAGVAVLQGYNQGAFLRAWSIEAQLSFFVLADLDGDGDLDLAGLSRDLPRRMTLLFHDGGGSFRESSLPREAFVTFLIPADMDGDGDADLLLGDDEAGTQILFSDGRGNLTPGAFIPEPAVKAGVAADLDGDGQLDLATTARDCECRCNPEETACDGRTSIFLNDGHGSRFDLAETHRSSYGSSGIATRDLDLDGDEDIVLPLSYHEEEIEFDVGHLPGDGIQVLRNDGAGAFRSWGTVITGTRPRKVLPADVDGDGYPELIVGSDGGIVVVRNLTRPPRSLDADGDGRLDGCEVPAFRRGDWNQDGIMNLSDPISLLGALFRGERSFGCDDAGDADDDGSLTITDAIRILSHLFLGGVPPEEPFERCLPDPTRDDGLFCPNPGGC